MNKKITDYHLSIKEAAKYMGVSYWVLRKLRTKRTGPRYIKIGGHIRYREKDLDDFILAHIVEPEHRVTRD